MKLNQGPTVICVAFSVLFSMIYSAYLITFKSLLIFCQFFIKSYAFCDFSLMSRVMRKPIMWFQNTSNTNWSVQLQKARSLKFWIEVGVVLSM